MQVGMFVLAGVVCAEIVRGIFSDQQALLRTHCS